MYNSMHGEQIELSQAYDGSLAGPASHSVHVTKPLPVPSPVSGLSQVNS